MVRTFTSEQADQAARQWLRAWDLLTSVQRIAIIAFCSRADADVAAVALKV